MFIAFLIYKLSEAISDLFVVSEHKLFKITDVKNIGRTTTFDIFSHIEKKVLKKLACQLNGEINW